jgi:hypothetical protein
MTVQVRLGTLLLDFISSLLIGLGVIAAFSPFALYWWIHADYNRYTWIIQGPYPYSNFGGGPFQMVLGLWLTGLAVLLLSAGGFLKWLMWRHFDAEFVL